MLKKVEAIIRKEKLSEVDIALRAVGVSGLTFFDVEGRGRAKGMEMVSGRGAATYHPEYMERVKLEVLARESEVQNVVGAIIKSAKTGEVGDGKILLLSLDDVWDITSGSSGDDAV